MSADGAMPADHDDLDIQTDGVWQAPIAESREPHEAGLEVVDCGSPAGLPKVYIHVDALQAIIDHVREDERNEVGGVLLGTFYLSHNKRVTDVRDALAAPQARGGHAHVTFGHDSWAAIHEQVDARCAGSIVGWYHSHPGFGVFLSKQDVFIQENFFDDAGHVALVIDPRKHKTGLFTWQERRGKKGVLPARGFWVTAPAGERERAEKLLGMLHYEVFEHQRDDESPGGLLGFLGGLWARLFGR
jgi:proteasome lid subunit RPN8/RPN11